MLINALISLIESFGLYSVLGFSYLGWGRAVGRLLKVNASSLSGLLNSVWMGWAVTLLIFQILNFWFPINAYVALPVFGAGLILSLIGLKAINVVRPVRIQNIWFIFVFFAFFVGIAVWAVKISMFLPTNYDSGLYHFQVIRWTNEYPIVPGLGNLHDRFAFNQSFFTYVAALNFYPFFNHGRSIANSFLFVLTVATLLADLRPVFLQPRILFHQHPFRYLPSIFMFPFLGNLLVNSDGFASPSPDLTIVLLQVLMFVMVGRGLAEWLGGNRSQDSDLALLAILASTSITIKLSNLAFSAVLLAVTVLYSWTSSHQKLKRLVRFLGIPVFIALVMCVRGYILSGMPLFPSMVGYYPFEWAVPEENVIDTANWTYSWARQEDKHWSEVLGKWDWIRPWLKRNSVNITDMVYPFFVAFAVGVAIFIMTALRKHNRPKILETVLILPAGLGLGMWFFTAPDPRFAKGLFFLLSASMLLVFLTIIYSPEKQKLYGMLVCAAFLVGSFMQFWILIDQRYAVRTTLKATFQVVPEVSLVGEQTVSGMNVFIPETGELCWDSPIPCAPRLNFSLSQRKSGDGRVVFFVERFKPDP